MTFVENGREGRPALALIATRTRRIHKGVNVKTVHVGDIRAVRLIAQADASGYNTAKRELMAIIGNTLRHNYRIAEGCA